MRFVIILLGVFALLVIPVITIAVEPQCEAADQCWFASPTGSGSICSYAQPCNIEGAADKLSGGDILYLLPGTYSQTYTHYQLQAIINFNKFFNFQAPQPTEQNPVVVKSLQPKQAVIQGDYSRQCIVLDKGGVHFDGLLVRQCHVAGIRIGYDLAADYVQVRNSLFEEIVATDNMGGVFVHSSKGVVIENNEFRDHYYIGTRDDLLSSGCSGKALVFFRAVDLTVRNNKIHRTCSGMYYKHGEAVVGQGGFTRIYGNVLYDLGRGGIESNQNRSEVYDNLVIGSTIEIHSNQDGTQSPNTTDSKVHHNTVVDGGIAIWQQRDGPSVGALRSSVTHNVFYDSDYTLWQYGDDQAYLDGIGLSSHSNCFYQSSGDQNIGYFAADNIGGPLGDDYTLSEFQAIEGFDLNSVEADPQFINPANQNYRLAEGSACKAIGAGVRFDQVVVDDSLCFPVTTPTGAMPVICL